MLTILLSTSLWQVSHSNTDFNLMWTGSHPKPHSFKSLLPHQVVVKQILDFYYHRSGKNITSESQSFFLLRSELCHRSDFDQDRKLKRFDKNEESGCSLNSWWRRWLTKSFQRVNHFPRSYELTRKDRWMDIVIILIKINTFQNIILVHIHIFTRAWTLNI